MIAAIDSFAPVADAPKPQRARSPRRSGDPSPKIAPARVAKSKDAGKTKVSFYLDAATADKLAVCAILRRADQSDVANEILGKALSSIAFYDRSTRPTSEALPVSEIDSDPTGD